LLGSFWIIYERHGASEQKTAKLQTVAENTLSSTKSHSCWNLTPKKNLGLDEIDAENSGFGQQRNQHPRKI
jgi:hypothetical protein